MEIATQTQIQKVEPSKATLSLSMQVLNIKYNSDTQELKIDFDGHKNIGNRKETTALLVLYGQTAKLKESNGKPKGIDVLLQNKI